MTKTPINYSKSSIYKIVCKDANIKDCYVGSTTNLTKRKYLHKSVCNNVNDKAYNCYLYQYIRENGGFHNWDFIEIEKFDCKTKEVVTRGAITKTILDTAKETSSDLIVLGHHKYDFFDSLLNRDIRKEVLSVAECPVLCC